MARVKASGLIFTPRLNPAGITALEIKFQPAMVISARKLDKLGLDIQSMKVPLTRAVKEVMIPSIRKNFDAGGRDPKWPRLTASTLKQRKYQGYGGSAPLIRSGLLRRTMGQLNIWTIDREKAFIQDLPSKIWYGKVHQGGAKGEYESFFDPVLKKHVNIGEDGSIPPRPFVVLRRMDEIKIQRIFNEWLGERIRLAGLGARA